MRRGKYRLMLGIILGIQLMVMGAVRANTISQFQPVATANVPFSTLVTFNRFDPALGTLTAVEIGGFVNTSANLQVFSINAAPENFTNAMSTNPVIVTSPEGLTTSVTAVAGPLAGVANPGLNTYPGIVGNNNFPNVFVAPANFNNYILSGPATTTVSLNFASGIPTYSGSPTIPGTLFFGGSTNGGGGVALTYFYTPSVSAVPLPAIAPAGLALIAVLGLAKTQRRAAV